ncbi:MAG: ribosome biogenesis GTP-binding protein YihA/YsxC [Chlamydiota bacterium]
MLEKARFLISTFSEFPELKDSRGSHLFEIAFAGRSNAGKSSLINHLCRQKNLAKASSTPGKTQLLNFFIVDEQFLLVDLPGYGFAKAPSDAVDKWSSAIDVYLNARPTLRLILLLIDSRREPNAQDIQLIEWAEHAKIPLWVILTKTDKLKNAEVLQHIEKARAQLRCEVVIPYSITDSASRNRIERQIKEMLCRK